MIQVEVTCFSFHMSTFGSPKNSVFVTNNHQLNEKVSFDGCFAHFDTIAFIPEEKNMALNNPVAHVYQSDLTK